MRSDVEPDESKDDGRKREQPTDHVDAERPAEISFARVDFPLKLERGDPFPSSVPLAEVITGTKIVHTCISRRKHGRA